MSQVGTLSLSTFGHRLYCSFTFHFLLQIEDGDIICFQKASVESDEGTRYPDIPSFLEFVHNRQVPSSQFTP